MTFKASLCVFRTGDCTGNPVLDFGQLLNEQSRSGARANADNSAFNDIFEDAAWATACLSSSWVMA